MNHVLSQLPASPTGPLLSRTIGVRDKPRLLHPLLRALLEGALPPSGPHEGARSASGGPARSITPTLYFADGDHPLGGVLVSNEFGVETRTTDPQGRIPNPPRDWVESGAKLRVYLTSRTAITVRVSHDENGLPQVIDIASYRKPDQGSGFVATLKSGLRIVWDHAFATCVLIAAAAVAYLAYWWLIRGQPPSAP